MKICTKLLRDSRFFPHSLMDCAVFLLCLLFFAIRDIPVLLYGGQVISFALIIWYKRRMIPVRFLGVWALFIAWSCLSIIWADSFPNFAKFNREILQVAAVSIVLALYGNSRETQERILWYIALSSLIMIVYFILKTPRSDWVQALYSNGSVASSADRFGRSIGMHPNTFGTLCAIEASVWLYYWRNSRRGVNLLPASFLTVLLLFTKSRGSLLMYAIIVISYWLLERKRTLKVIIRIMGSIIIIGVALWFVINNQFLYKLVGYRISGVIAYITGEGTVDASIRGRNRLIEAGIQIIQEHPLLGVGAGNYSNNAFTSYGIWREVYAHNNYIELWADLGIIGLLLYYIPRFSCMYRLIRHREESSQGQANLGLLFLAILIGTLITDYMKISYEKEPQQIFFALAFVYSSIERKKQNRRELFQ